MSDSQVTELNIGSACAFAMGATAVSMGYSVGLLMDNAVNNESQSQSVQNAAVSQCCVLMLAAGAAGAAAKGL